MDLQGLDNNVVEICDAIAGLEPDQARVLEDKMAVLIGGLETLARAKHPVAIVDHRRKLVLLRRDDVEHLVLLGTNSETLIEADIETPREKVIELVKDQKSG